VIHTGDVLEVLREYPDNHFHGMLTDPPYMLSFMGKSWDKALPSVDTWRQAHRVMMPGAHGLVFGHPRTFHRLAVSLEDAGFELRDTLMWLYGTGYAKSKTLADGIGTGLKPAYEPVLLIRKPLDGTLAENYAKYGTGGLNIAGAGIPRGSRKPSWPTNVAIDASPELQNQKFSPYYKTVEDDDRQTWLPHTAPPHATDVCDIQPVVSTDARYLYCPKVSTKEREAGCEHLRHVSAAENLNRSPTASGINNPRAGATRGRGAKNHHPTLKPIALTTWLATLIQVPNGKLLVPFSGAGSEMIGGYRAGWQEVVGIERDPSYVEIAESRLRFQNL
jgi:hypothetical protein